MADAGGFQAFHDDLGDFLLDMKPSSNGIR